MKLMAVGVLALVCCVILVDCTADQDGRTVSRPTSIRTAGPVAGRVLRTAETMDAMPGEVDTSPDGSRLAYVNTNDGGVYVREVGSGEVRQVAPGNPDAWNYSPLWSPDCRRLAYAAQDHGTGMMSVRIVALPSLEVTVVPGTSMEGWIDVEDWSRDGRHLLCGRAPQLVLIAVDDGTTTVVADDLSRGNATLSPDGRFVAYAMGDADRAQIFIQPVAGDARSQVTWTLGGNQRPRWAPDGRAIAYQSRFGIWVVPVADGVPAGDARRALSATDLSLARWTDAGLYYAQYTDTDQRSVPYQVAMDPATGRPVSGEVQLPPGYLPDSLSAFAWSPDMRRVFYSHRNSTEVTVTFTDPKGVMMWDLGRSARVHRPQWSKDGSDVSFEPYTRFENGWTVVRLDVATGRVRQAFPPKPRAAGFSLSADGRRMAFLRLGQSIGGGRWPSAGPQLEAIVVAATGESDGQVVATGGSGEMSFSSALRPVISLQGDRVLFIRQTPLESPEQPTPQASSLWVVGSDGSSARQLATAAFIQSAIWDPTGRFIAYTAKPETADGYTVLRVIEVAGGAETNIPLPGHIGRRAGTQAFVRAVDWSRDGTLLGLIAGQDYSPWEYWAVQGLEETD
jgi:Tol biopolymer transport system component